MTSTRPFSVPFSVQVAAVPATAPTASITDRPSCVRRAGTALALVLMLAAGAVGAQTQAPQTGGVYRHVMPDGRIVYSDRPEDGAGQTSRLIAPQIRAATPGADAAAGKVEAKSPEAKAAEEVAERLRGAKAGAKSAIRPPAQAAAPAPAPAQTPVATAAPEPALVQSLMGVLGKADLLKRFGDTCTRTLPTSMNRYMDAVEGWQRRNGETVGQATRILEGGMRPEHAQVISSEIKRIGDREFVQVSSASMAQRIKWCDNGVDEIKAGKLDVFNNATLTRPLAAFGRT